MVVLKRINAIYAHFKHIYNFQNLVEWGRNNCQKVRNFHFISCSNIDFEFDMVVLVKIDTLHLLF